MGANFAIATDGVLTLFIAAPPNGSLDWARVVDEVSGAVFEQEFTADLPANTLFLSPRLFKGKRKQGRTVLLDDRSWYGVCSVGGSNEQGSPVFDAGIPILSCSKLS